MIDAYRLLPQYWIQLYPTDKYWDKLLNELLDNYQPKQSGMHVVTLNDCPVWVSNWPYAYGHPYNSTIEVLPAVATRRRLKSAVDAMSKQALQKYIKTTL